MSGTYDRAQLELLKGRYVPVSGLDHLHVHSLT
jgi:hypothetical protein